MRATLPDRDGYARLWGAVSAFLDNVRPPRATGLQPLYQRTDRMIADLLIDKPPTGVNSVEVSPSINGVGQSTVTVNAPFSPAPGNDAKILLPNVASPLAIGDKWDGAVVLVSVGGIKADPTSFAFVVDVKPPAASGIEAVYHD